MVDYSKHTVLIVDDEVEILKSLNRGLHSEKYNKVFASSGAQALEIFSEENEISVVITDMRMPGMTGLELLKHIDQISPKTVKIVLTGYTQLPQILATVNNVDIYKFLTKPWDLETELKVYIREAIDQYENSTIEHSRMNSIEKKGVLYNKMLNDSYEKVDYVLKLYDELIKAINQHHLFSIQALKKVESIEQLSPILHQLNDRVHYLNKVFEMSRYSMKTFELADFKEVIEKGFSKLEISNLKIELAVSESETVYSDNFKLISSIVVDVIETMQFNGPGISKIIINVEDAEVKNIVHFVIESPLNDKLREILEIHNKFVEVIVKIVGGRFYASEVAENERLELFFPINKKAVETIL